MASSYLLSAVALYKAPHWTGLDSNNVITINVDQIQAFTPRPAWILRYLVPGQNQIQYLVTFEPTSAQLLDANTLTGVYVEQYGQGVVVDCINVANFVSAADTSGTLTQKYAGGVPLFVSPTAIAWCISRADDGSGFSHDNVVTDYLTQYIGNVRMRSNISGVSHYIVFSYTQIVAIGTDTVTAGACTS
jgi:hypothetical protein